MGDFQAELDSITTVANGMTNGAIATATQLKSVLSKLAGSTTPNDWSSVESCQAFGASYVAAIKAYEKAAEDMLSDAQDMQNTLLAVAKEYGAADERRRDDFNARMAALGTEKYMTETQNQRQGYDADQGDLHSDDAQQAPDQAPATATSGQPAPGTTTSGSGGGSSQGSQK